MIQQILVCNIIANSILLIIYTQVWTQSLYFLRMPSVSKHLPLKSKTPVPILITKTTTTLLKSPQTVKGRKTPHAKTSFDSSVSKYKAYDYPYQGYQGKKDKNKWTPSEIITEIDKIKERIAKMTASSGRKWRKKNKGSAIRMRNNMAKSKGIASKMCKASKMSQYMWKSSQEQHCQCCNSIACCKLNLFTEKLAEQKEKPQFWRLSTLQSSSDRLVNSLVSYNCLEQRLQPQQKRLEFCRRSRKDVYQSNSVSQNERYRSELRKLQQLNRNLLIDNCLLENRLLQESNQKQELKKKLHSNIFPRHLNNSQYPETSYTLNKSQQEEKQRQILGPLIRSGKAKQHEFGIYYNNQMKNMGRKRQELKENLQFIDKYVASEVFNEKPIGLPTGGQTSYKVGNSNNKAYCFYTGNETFQRHQSVYNSGGNTKFTTPIRYSNTWRQNHHLNLSLKVNKKPSKSPQQHLYSQISESQGMVIPKRGHSTPNSKKTEPKKTKISIPHEYLFDNESLSQSNSILSISIGQSSSHSQSNTNTATNNTESILLDQSSQKPQKQKLQHQWIKINNSKGIKQNSTAIRLQRLEQYFNQLIKISRMEKRTQKKLQLRKNLSEIAKQIQSLRNGSKLAY